MFQARSVLEIQKVIQLTGSPREGTSKDPKRFIS
jgi:hypothetical protein